MQFDVSSLVSRKDDLVICRCCIEVVDSFTLTDGAFCQDNVQPWKTMTATDAKIRTLENVYIDI
jgi:hypothetical protein